MAAGSVALELEQRVVLLAGVEGAAGESIAQAFADSGAWVVVHSCQDLEGTKRIVDRVRSTGGRAMPAIGVTDDAASAWTLIERIVVEWAQLDVLVCDVAGLATQAGRTAVTAPSTPPEVGYLTAEAINRMRTSGGGRIIVLLPPAADLQSDGDMSPEPNAAWIRSLAAAASADRVLVNAVQCAEGVAAADLARVLLFLGSTWNTAVSGSCLTLHGPNCGGTTLARFDVRGPLTEPGRTPFLDIRSCRWPIRWPRKSCGTT